MEAEDAPHRLTEREKVELWRLEELLAVGYPLHIAEKIAKRFDVDLHRAVELVMRGCDPLVAERILL